MQIAPAHHGVLHTVTWTMSFFAQRTLNTFTVRPEFPWRRPGNECPLKRLVVNIACTLWAGSQPQGDRHEDFCRYRENLSPQCSEATYRSPDNRATAILQRCWLAISPARFASEIRIDNNSFIINVQVWYFTHSVRKRYVQKTEAWPE